MEIAAVSVAAVGGINAARVTFDLDVHTTIDDAAQLLERARSGEAAARRMVLARTGLRTARVVLGESATDRHAALRELERGDGPAPALAILLAAIARDGDGELRRALELVHRANRRWGPPERAAIGQLVAGHGARLGAELALELVEWAAGAPEDPIDFIRGAAAALRDARLDQLEQLAWRRGFGQFVLRERDLVIAWSATAATAKPVAKAMFSAHAQGASCVPALDAIWLGTARRDVWSAALGDASAQNHGITGRDEIVTWSWRRFCEHADERRDLHVAFARWRDLWIERRNAMAALARPGGDSAVAHLALWGGLDVQHLSAAVDEAVRLARDGDWPALVDTAFDLATTAPRELRRHALAGACRIGHEITHRIREGPVTSGLDAGANRLIARSLATCTQLRESGALLDDIVANRVDDFEVNVRLIREARDRVVERAQRDADRAQRDADRAQRDADRTARDARRQLELEAAKLSAELARRAAEEARHRAEAELRARLDAAPEVTRRPIDDEVFFSSLPAPTLWAYARLFQRLTSGGDVMQSLAADGVSLEMIAVINQTWGALFTQRPELAMRFSVLISSRLA